MTNGDSVIGTQEAARRLGVSVRTIQLWVERGTLDAWKTPGGHRRISAESVDRALASRRQPSAAPASDRLRVLVVEDDATMQSYYRALLEVLRPDAELVAASDGYEGLVCLGRVSPNVMLVDIDMPGMDGIAMLERVADKDIGRGATIAVVTGLSDDQLRERGGVPAGIPVYPKPLSIDSLGELLDAVGQAEAEEAGDAS